MLRGLSFSSESRSAPRTIFESQIALLTFSCAGHESSEGLSGAHQQVLEYRPQAQGREKCQRADDQMTPISSDREQWRCHGECAQVMVARISSAPDCRQSPAWG